MDDYPINAKTLLLIERLKRCSNTSNIFIIDWMTDTLKLTEEVILLYQTKVTELQRKITELEKELVFKDV